MRHKRCSVDKSLHSLFQLEGHLQDFAPRTEHMTTTGSRHRVVCNKQWFRPSYMVQPPVYGERDSWHSSKEIQTLVLDCGTLTCASCAAINPNFQEMAWKSLSLEWISTYQHYELLDRFNSAITQVGIEQTNQSTSRMVVGIDHIV